jgi:hypothetical protein
MKLDAAAQRSLGALGGLPDRYFPASGSTGGGGKVQFSQLPTQVLYDLLDPGDELTIFGLNRRLLSLHNAEKFVTIK